ncbi:unnamed protein product [Ectocarpus sp. CCAP 1310/34]|nr:unnamed protein product [Ectocarpus sp. CCAP 1310/34]
MWVSDSPQRAKLLYCKHPTEQFHQAAVPVLQGRKRRTSSNLRRPRERKVRR